MSLWARRWPLGALQPHKYNKVYMTLECIPHRRTIQLLQQLYSYRGQLLPDDSIRFVHVWELPSLILQLDSQGGQEKPAIQETWMGPRQLTSSFPTKLLCYNFSIGALVTRQTKLYLGNFFFLIHLFFHSVLSVFEETQYLPKSLSIQIVCIVK
jgi:hypothetical protein